VLAGNVLAGDSLPGGTTAGGTTAGDILPGDVLLGGADDPDDPYRRPYMLRAMRVACAALASELVLPPVRIRALRLLGASIGKGTIIEGNVRVTLPARLVTGENVYVNFDCLLDTLGGIVLEEEVRVGPATLLMTTTHDIGRHDVRAGERRYRPIVVGAGAWLGGGVTVLPGARIGRGCVVGGGAVVSGELEADGLYLGSPARRVRDLS
jgi:maltose O-acetyltransferase